MISKSVLSGILKSLLILSIIKYVKGNKVGDPIFLGEIQNQTISEGGNVKFACQVDNLGSYKVAWINYDKSTILTVANHVITRNQRITISHDEHQKTWYLHISEARETDSGKYVCQINTDSAMTIAGYLTVVVPPEIVDDESTGDVIAHKGSDVHLRCKARGSPKPIITWKREDNKTIYVNKSTKSTGVIGEVLTLSKVFRKNMGAYLCIASNGYPPTVSKRILVTVNFPPVIWNPNQLIGVYIGYTITLECFVEAHPTSLNYWTREDGGMIYDSDKYKIENRTAYPEYKIHMLLTLRHLEEEDFGRYRCVAKNLFGEADASIVVYKIWTPSTTTEIPNAKEIVDEKNDDPASNEESLFGNEPEIFGGTYGKSYDDPASNEESLFGNEIKIFGGTHGRSYDDPDSNEESVFGNEIKIFRGTYGKSYDDPDSNEESVFGNEIKIFGGTYGKSYDDPASNEESSFGNELKIFGGTHGSSYVPPLFWIPHELIGTYIGSTVTLECFIEADPAWHNYWTRGDSKMIYDSVLPVVWSYYQLMGTYIGSTVTIECHIEAHPTSINYWTTEDGDRIYDSDKYRIETRMGNTEYKIHLLLTVHHLEEEDFGTYRCVANNSLGESDDSILLYKTEPPPTTTEIPSAKENEDEKNDSGPPPTTTEIPNAKENEDEKNVFPVVWSYYRLMGTFIGSTVTIECHIEAHPTSINYWTTEDGDMIYDSDKYRIETRMGNPEYKIHLLLTVRHLEEEDFGTYRCVAKNALGEADDSVLLYKNAAKKRPDALKTNEVEAGFKFLFRLPIFKFLCEVLA